jgi:acyl-CoA reductase-like NAD-dependent aldehyde dehydrogenase
LAKGGYYHAGQVCVSVQRIFVHADLQQALLDGFAARVAALKTGDPVLAETEVGPLITPHEADRVSAWIDEAVASGARLIGGGRLSNTTLRPAILVNPARDAKVSTLEVFGPVTCVYPYTRLEDALTAANALPWSFQASIFTEDLRTAFAAAERLAASAVMVNDHTAFRTDWMPFAGRRQSGYGVGGIPYTMREMTEEKMIVFRM